MSSNPEKKIVWNLALLMLGATAVYFFAIKPATKKRSEAEKNK
jgi:hypothetical protein